MQGSLPSSIGLELVIGMDIVVSAAEASTIALTDFGIYMRIFTVLVVFADQERCISWAGHAVFDVVFFDGEGA